MDCEVLQQFERYFEPSLTDTSPDALGVDAIAEVGAHGHFFGASHTRSRYATAFYAPFLSDWRNYEAWAEAGAVTTERRANRVWKAILAEYEPPPMDDGIREELAEFVARRKREGGAPTDF
jgi:trimethylamine--corrinoid protein Co-methyltransferase